MNETTLIQVLNYSVFKEIYHIKLLFDQILQKNFSFVYAFDHNSNELENEQAINTTEFSNHCDDCLYNCHPFVIYQASQYPKSYIDFYESILLEKKIDLSKTVGFGINGIFQFLQQQTEKTFNHVSERKQKKKHEGQQRDYDGSSLKGLRIQAGGGSGLGFQLYCDNAVILTAGGGGGGGYYLNGEDMMYNFGAGGGAGLQFANLTQFINKENAIKQINLESNLSFVSVGAGGGCGTCNDPTDDEAACRIANRLYPNSSQSLITCGFKHDEDDLSDEPVRNLLIAFHQYTTQCKELTIYGGGGGGGGSSPCCQPYHIGYGFSFSLHYINDPTLPRSEMFYNFHTEQSESKDDDREKESNYESNQLNNNTAINDRTLFNNYPTEDIRYHYDFMGKLLHDSSKSCNGFANWCCVCNETQVLIRTCLKSDIRTTRTNFTKVTADWNTSHFLFNPNCLDIQRNYAKISWLVNHACCPSNLSDRSPDYNSSRNASNLTNNDILQLNESNLLKYYKFYHIPTSLLKSFQKALENEYYQVVVINLHENGASESSAESFNLFQYENHSFEKLVAEFSLHSVFSEGIAELSLFAESVAEKHHRKESAIPPSSLFNCEQNYYKRESLLGTSKVRADGSWAIQLLGSQFLLFCLAFLTALTSLYFFHKLKRFRSISRESVGLLKESHSNISKYGSFE